MAEQSEPQPAPVRRRSSIPNPANDQEPWGLRPPSQDHSQKISNNNRPSGMTNTGKEIFREAFRALRPRTAIPEFEVVFRPYADVTNVIRVRNGKALVSLSDLLQGAPRAVLEAIAFILICKLYRKPIPKRYQDCYRRFLNRRTVRNQVQTIRRVRGRKWVGTAQGEHFNLDEIFEQLNQKYFGGLLGRPQLSWSRANSRTILGHFDTAHNAIIISKIFDRPGTPSMLVEYILYHEMLHLKYPVIHSRDRNCFHSSVFREEEKRFPQFDQAKQLLDNL